MRIRPRSAFLAAAAVLCGGAVAAGAPALAASTPKPAVTHDHHGTGSFPHMDHVFVIMMENTSSSALLDPSNTHTAYIQQLAKSYGLATHYYGVTHTSLPNYIATLTGSTWGSNSDDPAQSTYFNHYNLVDQLEQAHVSWKAYMESLPSVGYAGAFGSCTNNGIPDPTCGANDTSSALYVIKHDPFMLIPDIAQDPARAADVVPLTQLTSDLNTNNVPQFAWITPNICNDMHGGAPACPYASAPNDAAQQALYQNGDNFVRSWVSAITHSRAWTGNSAIFITWDEGSYADTAPYGPLDNSGCCDSPVLPASPANPTAGSGGDLVGGTLYGGGLVPMIVVARHGTRGATDATPANHYSLLQTIEQNWSLGYLGHAGDLIQVHSLAPLLEPRGGGRHR